MARAKIQFNDDEAGKEAWEIIKFLQDAYYDDDVRELKAKEDELKDNFPNASISITAKKMSAPDIVLLLLRNEMNRYG